MNDSQDAAAARAEAWHRTGRFIYRNRHGAVGYVDDPESNPGLLDLIEVRGKDSELTAERLHAELSKFYAGEPDQDQRPGPAAAIANIEAFLRDMASEPHGQDDEQLVATAPMNPPDGGSRQQGMITIGDLKAVVAAFRPYPAPVIEISRKRIAQIEDKWVERIDPDRGEVAALLRLARAYLDSPMNADPAPALQERAEICKVLGCVDKPGVPLRFIQDLQARLSQAYERNTELMRSWDKATPTERQELDRMRRGWGPSSPTERQRRHEDLALALKAVSVAMQEVTVSEEEADDISDETQRRLDAAYAALDMGHSTLLEVQRGITADPQEWPDIKAAEERGAMQAQVAPNEMLIADNRRMRAAGLKLAEAAMFVVREFDGTHRLSLAAAEWANSIGDEGGRGERYAGPPEFEPGRIAFEVRWPAPRETEWSELTDEQRTVWARVEAASRAIGGSEARS